MFKSKDASNTDKIYGEYPFLENIQHRSKTRNAYVRRWSDDTFHLGTRCYHECLDSYTLFLLDEKGAVVTRVGRSWIPFLIWEETVDQALARIGNDEAQRVRYTVFMYGVDLTLIKR